MASRNKTTEGPPKRKDEQFNNPFSGLKKDLVRVLKRRRKEAADKPLPKRSEDEASLPPKVDDRTAYAASIAGVAPLEGKKRVPASPNRKESEVFFLDRHDAEDLARLSAADGFDLSYSERFVRGRVSGVSRNTVDRLARGEFAVREHIDLHGLCVEDALHVVDDFIREHQARGSGCVLVITGKGTNSPHQQGVLCKQVPEWLARGPSSRRVLAFVTARPCDGGDGALYVMLRSRSGKKHHIDLEMGGVGSWDK